MPYDLPGQISNAGGRPAKVRIGTVTSTAPLTVVVQDTAFTGLGFLASYTPVVGHTVALIGQSSISSDQSSWLILGRVDS